MALGTAMRNRFIGVVLVIFAGSLGLFLAVVRGRAKRPARSPKLHRRLRRSLRLLLLPFFALSRRENLLPCFGSRQLKMAGLEGSTANHAEPEPDEGGESHTLRVASSPLSSGSLPIGQRRAWNSFEQDCHRLEHNSPALMTLEHT